MSQKAATTLPAPSHAKAGSFLNGRAQVIELLQVLTSEEKINLLKNLKIKNPQLALELSKESLSFRQIEKLEDHEIILIFRYVSAPIMGVALKGTPLTLQRRVLALAPREYAEEAYTVMISPIREEQSGVKRAQQKVLNTILMLYQKKQIELL